MLSKQPTMLDRFGLRRRRVEPELMDQPDLDQAAHRAALHGLTRINRLSLADRPLRAAIEAELAPADAPLRLLDLACGGGDLLAALARHERLRLAGCDAGTVALAVTRARLGEAVERLMPCDLLAEVPEGFDVLTCSLFLHHLDTEQAERFLCRAADAAGRLLLVDDLERGLPGYLLAATVPRLVTRSRIVHVDAVRSVRAAFTVAEARALAARAGLHGAIVRRHWPCRWLLTWRRP